MISFGTYEAIVAVFAILYASAYGVSCWRGRSKISQRTVIYDEVEVIP